MYLTSLIQSYIHNPENSYISAENKEIVPSHIIKEYSSIKNYLLDNFTSDDIIGICLTKDYVYMLTMLACMEVGLTYVPLNINWPKHRIAQIKKLASLCYIFHNSDIMNITNYSKISKKTTFNKSAHKALYIIFTSGSTGEPKGVIIKRESLENFFRWMESYFEVTEQDILLQVTDFSFDMSLVDIAFLLIKNLKVVFSVFSADVFRLGYEIENYKISIVNTVPNNINMLLSDNVKDRVNFNSLNTIIVGGARFSYGLYKKLQFFKEIQTYNFYGPTEATVYATIKKIDHNEKTDMFNHNISIGKPIANVKAKIINIQKNEGELYLGGVQIMQGYINKLETDSVLKEIDGVMYYKTGDIAVVDDTDEYYIIGRLDDTIKRKGYRINLQDIDSYMHKVNEIMESATIAIEDELSEHILISYIQTKDKNLSTIKAELKKYLTPYQFPDKIIEIDHFPINNSGKICKKTLKSLYIQSRKGK